MLLVQVVAVYVAILGVAYAGGYGLSWTVEKLSDWSIERRMK